MKRVLLAVLTISTLTGCAIPGPYYGVHERQIAFINTADRPIVAVIVTESSTTRTVDTAEIGPLGQRQFHSWCPSEDCTVEVRFRLTHEPLTADDALDPQTNTTVVLPTGRHRYELSVEGERVVATEVGAD